MGEGGRWWGGVYLLLGLFSRLFLILALDWLPPQPHDEQQHTALQAEGFIDLVHMIILIVNASRSWLLSVCVIASIFHNQNASFS